MHAAFVLPLHYHGAFWWRYIPPGAALPWGILVVLHTSGCCITMGHFGGAALPEWVYWRCGTTTAEGVRHYRALFWWCVTTKGIMGARHPWVVFWWCGATNDYFRGAPLPEWAHWRCGFRGHCDFMVRLQKALRRVIRSPWFSTASRSLCWFIPTVPAAMWRGMPTTPVVEVNSLRFVRGGTSCPPRVLVMDTFPMLGKLFWSQRNKRMKKQSLCSEGTKINITTQGKKYLGCPLGSAELRQKFTYLLDGKFAKQLRNLSNAAIAYPHEAYSAFTQCLKSKWSYYARTIDVFSIYSSPLDVIIEAEFLPNITGQPCGNERRTIYSLSCSPRGPRCS